METIEQNFRIRIDNYVKVDFDLSPGHQYPWRRDHRTDAAGGRPSQRAVRRGCLLRRRQSDERRTGARLRPHPQTGQRLRAHSSVSATSSRRSFTSSAPPTWAPCFQSWNSSPLIQTDIPGGDRLSPSPAPRKSSSIPWSRCPSWDEPLPMKSSAIWPYSCRIWSRTRPIYGSSSTERRRPASPPHAFGGRTESVKNEFQKRPPVSKRLPEAFRFVVFC